MTLRSLPAKGADCDEIQKLIFEKNVPRQAQYQYRSLRNGGCYNVEWLLRDAPRSMLDTLVVVGVNHDSALVMLRERIAFALEKVHESLGALI